MGRTEPSIGRPPAAFRKDVRAKKAKATINKVIPSLLPGNPRAQKGIDKARLVNPDIALWKAYEEEMEKEKQSKDKKHKRKDSKDMEPDDQVEVSAKKESDYQAKPEAPQEEKVPRISLRVADTLTVARDLLEIELSSGDKVKVDLGNKFARVGILNMSSPLSPGGGFLNGANSQEESLCMRTTLYPSLKDEWYRIPELCAIYTPDVLVFRDEEAEDLDKKDRFYVDCITAAMIRGPEFYMHDEEGVPVARYSNIKDVEMVYRKMRMVMRICVQMKMKRIVLGAWGCGAHGNPVQDLAKTWRKVLRPTIEGSRSNLSNLEKLKQKEKWEQIEEVVFAIKDPNMAEAFAAGFGEELELADEEEGDEEEEDEVKATDSALDKQQELRNKIEELELRIKYRATDPDLKAGLEAILKGLQKQLADC
ncbi:hypothetical protein FSARC_2605 [Fusarium sarcochroum]|uniref:Microbial-type PARG catalytic domain-containing protein n=1 Tax=Fusarium sarcochroum TaxID=1208366 RepID=A0A8H4U696_9HYPO|nr:hypothetical protein FSARC_2605 [Fusarium sarcochroum]